MYLLIFRANALCPAQSTQKRIGQGTHLCDCVPATCGSQLDLFNKWIGWQPEITFNINLIPSHDVANMAYPACGLITLWESQTVGKLLFLPRSATLSCFRVRRSAIHHFNAQPPTIMIAYWAGFVQIVGNMGKQQTRYRKYWSKIPLDWRLQLLP